mmetsp:Transcript_82588/g.164750  ORF Transcript_82588/g.164750 Transcript_82588/m.164750 type:complete len:284 (+) Transcript_82588:360-1211(+)
MRGVAAAAPHATRPPRRAAARTWIRVMTRHSQIRVVACCSPSRLCSYSSSIGGGSCSSRRSKCSRCRSSSSAMGPVMPRANADWKSNWNNSISRSRHSSARFSSTNCISSYSSSRQQQQLPCGSNRGNRRRVSKTARDMGSSRMLTSSHPRSRPAPNPSSTRSTLPSVGSISNSSNSSNILPTTSHTSHTIHNTSAGSSKRHRRRRCHISKIRAKPPVRRPTIGAEGKRTWRRSPTTACQVRGAPQCAAARQPLRPTTPTPHQAPPLQLCERRTHFLPRTCSS